MKTTPARFLPALAMLALAIPAFAHASTAAIPTALDKLESISEDTYDLAYAGKFAQVTKNAATIRLIWQRYRPDATRAGASPQLVGKMDKAVADLSAAAPHARPGENVKLARLADAVTADMDQLFALYHPTTPTGIMKLDYLGRELVLDGTAGDFDAAGRHFQEMSSDWAALKPAILHANGANEARVYDQSLVDLKVHLGTRDGAAVVKAANVGLDDIDAMEKLFP